ncbi:unnamed protein product [Lymnaea stagnalis]|uniref:Genetic suppressor element-like domain-containing protein n=1 Tax=Lymnaea stagnalis TaxID=6523 RepID=A0AAV2IMX7_LYMST
MPSRIVCFVCGSLGGEYQLHSQPHEGQAFFPFLEHHDPPKGSRIPGADGIVDSCRVCCAFLTQQWDTYERTNTPAIKRLYWLKRIDDGQFTGAEMKLQGEYMAQVMGLQYQPSCGDSCAPLSPDSRDDFSVGNREFDYSVNRKQDCDDGVLDLSVPIKTEVNIKSCSKSSSENPVLKPGLSTSRLNLDELSFVCYTCGNQNQGVAAKLISSIYHVANKPYFPFLTKLNPPERATPMNDQGVCQVCDHCFSSLCHQWLTYEQQGSPNSARIFKINGVFYTNDSSIVAGPGKDIKTNVKEVCYLCSQSWPLTKMCPLFTAPVSGKKDQMYFPFIRELRRPHGARPLNPDGSVHVCYSCFGNLQIQWHQYETERVPFLHRRYSLLPPSSSTSVLGFHTSVEPDIKPKTFNIEDISRHSAKEQNRSPSLMKTALPVLNTAATLNNTSTTTSHEAAKYYKEDSKSSVSNSCISIPHPLQQAGERPKKVCFLCGEKCLVTKAQILYSYPIRHETKSVVGQPHTLPFFPFLASHDPAPGSEPMTEDGIVISCSYCYYSLLNQWKEFEESKVHADLNRWLRRYKLNEFVCFVCGMMVPRKKLRTLEVQKFLFLREHKAPSNALVMWGGQAVGACGSCHFSLTHQYTEFERLGLPIELRKYNWTVQHHTEESSSDTQNSNHGQDLTVSVANEDNGMVDVNEAYHSGFSTSGKLTLNQTSSSSGRLPISAIMQSSNHISPSSNSTTCLSSFSAALRKLAHQTKDSSEDATIKHNMSPTSLNSSRSTTPKRAHVPLVLPSKSNSFISTQGQNSISLDIHRQNLERLQSSNNVSPLDYGSRSGLEHHLLRLDSRDDSRSTGRDSRDGRIIGRDSREDNSATGRDSRDDGRNTGRDSRDGRNTCRDSRDDGRNTGRDSRDGHNTGRDSRDDGRNTGRDSRDGHVTGRDSRNDVRAFGRDSREDIKGTGRDSRDRDGRSSVRDSRDDGRGLIRDDGAITGRDSYLSSMHSRLPASELFSRDFHSYHSEEDAARHGLTLPLRIDPAAYMAATAAYHPLLLQQQAVFAQNPFRLDDPLFIEQYRMLQSSFLPFSGAGFLPGQTRGMDVHSMLAAAAATQHYPMELLQQHYPYLSPSHPLLNTRFAAQSAVMERNSFDEEKPRLLAEKGKEQERLLDWDIKPDPTLTSERDLKRLSDVDRYLPGRQSKESLKQDFLTLPSRVSENYAHYHHMGEISASGLFPSSNSTRLGQTHSSGLKMGSKLSPRETREKSPLTSFYPSSLSQSHSFLLSQESYIKKQNADYRSPEAHSPPKMPKMITNSNLNPSSHDYSQQQQIQGGNSASTFLSQPTLHGHQGSLPLSHLLSPSYSSPALSLSTDPTKRARCGSDSKTLFRPFDDSQGTESQINHSVVPEHEEISPLKSSGFQSTNNLSHGLSLLTHTTSSGDHHPAILSIPTVKPVVNPPPFEIKDRLPPLLNSTLPHGQLKLDPLSSYVRDKVERFDFKSLARECTSSAPNSEQNESKRPDVGRESKVSVEHLSSSVNVSPQPYFSKLDHEEVKMRKRKFKRDSGTDSDDEKDLDDRMIVRLTMIGRATPIPLDTPADKMAILEYLGVTTMDKKKELQRDKEIRRRRQLRLASISPIQYETDETMEFNLKNNSLSHRPRKQTNLDNDPFKSTPESSPEKSQFLSDLGLVPLSSNNKAVVAAGREAEDG